MAFTKIKKHVISCAFMALLVAGLVPVAAFAVSPEAPATVDITIHKRSTSTVGTPNNSGEVDLAPGGVPLPGAGFGLFKVDYSSIDLDGTPGNPDTREIVLGQASFWMDSTGAVAATDGNVPTHAKLSVQKQAWNSVANSWNDEGAPRDVYCPVEAAANYDGVTDGDGSIKWTGVAASQAWYVLVETSSPAGYAAGASSLISTLITKSDGTGYNTDIHIYPKNTSTAPISKTFVGGTPSVVVKDGDVLNYYLEGRFSSSDATNKVNSAADLKDGSTYGGFKIVDKSFGLVNAAGAPGVDMGVGAPVFVVADGTTVNLVPADYTWTEATSAFELTTAGIDHAIAATAVSVRLEVTGTVNSVSGANPGAGIQNSAEFSVWAANDTTPPDPELPPVVVAPSLSIIVDKINADGGAKLSGATFAIKKEAAGTDYLLKDGTWGPEGNPANPAITGVTDTQGRVLFAAVSSNAVIANGSNFTCYLVEQAAPAGFQLNLNAIRVDFTDIQAAVNDSWQKTVEVKNYANGTLNPSNPVFTLPLTGGMGTTLFTIVGLVLVGGAVVLYVGYRKNAKKQMDN